MQLHPGLSGVNELTGYAHDADLYLTKPTEPQELCAAVQALAHRLTLSAPKTGTALTLDLVARILHTPDGTVELRASEANILHALALAPDNMLDTWQLIVKLGKSVDQEGQAQLQVVLSRLRTKLISHGATTNPIRAERGKGYQLRLQLPLRLK